MRKAIIGAVVLLTAGMTAQQPSSIPSPPIPFGWDYRKAEQVDYRHTINSTKELNSIDRTALIDAVAVQMGDIALEAEQPVRAIAAEMPIKLVDLNGDGKPEILAQAAGTKSGCSPTGNCPFWVFQRVIGGYSLLLGSEAQIFRVQSNSTNGFRDIVLSRHSSAFESEVTEYKFNGTSYVSSACYNFLWGTGDQTFKQPHVKPCS
jgi:hypothetical protein